MKVLVIGGGGREHALVWKIAQSHRVKKVYCAPGNAGIAEQAECVNIAADDIEGLLHFAKKEQIDLTVPGPEVPLVEGIVNVFEKAGLKIFGPTKSAAAIEGSKAFAKSLMRRHGIPTAEYQAFSDFETAKSYVETLDGEVVIKADGLAAGKGVVICSGAAEAVAALSGMMQDGQFGKAGDKVIVEELLKGEEVSILAITDGKAIVVLESSQDHKAAYDGDKGPNTGGMGAVSPTPLADDKVINRVIDQILVPIVHGMKKEGNPYTGVLYAGLMLTPTGPKVLEFNCRFGDPETQAVLFRLKSDLVDLLWRTAERNLEGARVPRWDKRPAVTVVMASGGYPGSYKKGLPINGLHDLRKEKDVFVFHAGTRRDGKSIVTDGGRVLGVTAFGGDVQSAKKNAYRAVEKISFEDAFYRGDIGDKAID